VGALYHGEQTGARRRDRWESVRVLIACEFSGIEHLTRSHEP
jgi:hypothetical protein